MPRIARIIAVGYPHHITQRGNNKCRTFLDDEDYNKYLFLLEKYSRKYRLDIYSYSPMPTHVHIEAIPAAKNSLAAVMHSTQMVYTQYFNKKYKKAGHLWQSRFFSCVLDVQHAYSVAKYIELNPVKAGLVETPEAWRWSSARQHLGIETGPISLFPMKDIIDIPNWRKYLQENLTDTIEKAIDKHTLSGKPLGSENFMRKLEKKFHVSYSTKPVGRPMMPD